MIAGAVRELALVLAILAAIMAPAIIAGGRPYTGPAPCDACGNRDRCAPDCAAALGRPCGACGADAGEECRPLCIGGES